MLWGSVELLLKVKISMTTKRSCIRTMLGRLVLSEVTRTLDESTTHFRELVTGRVLSNRLRLELSWRKKDNVLSPVLNSS